MSDMGRQPLVEDDVIIETISHHPERVVTAQEISDIVGLERQSVNKRLNDLRDRGILSRKQTGSGHVWWVSESP